ncbi:MAG: SDR family NAD(P)-dependent oxidoreductase [Flavobacteriales bacterium]
MEAVITGGSSGIGKAIARKLAEAGYHLHLIARDLNKLESTKKEITKEFPAAQVNAISADLYSVEEVENAIQIIRFKAYKVNILVHAAADYDIGSLLEGHDGLLEKQMQSQVFALHQLLNGLLPALTKYEGNMVIVIGSVASTHLRPSAAHYSIAKAAQENYCRLMADELRELGVRMTLIAPGSVNTPSWDEEDAQKDFFVQPEDIALVVQNALQMSKETWMEKITLRPMRKGI